MAELNREYVIPLRRKTKHAPQWRRSKKAIVVLKEFVRKHMKCEDVVIGKDLNELVWVRGSKNPPGKVSVFTSKIQVNGADKVIVETTKEGLDKQLDLYKSAAPVATKDAEAEVKDAEAKEVKKEEAPKKEAPKKEEAKAESKTEVKKDE
jgi:large subunit ribosomal protein L31e